MTAALDLHLCPRRFLPFFNSGFTMLASPPKLNFIRWFDEIGIGDVPLVGGKNASLGEMYRELGPQGINLAYGFAITAPAYREFLQTTGLDQEIKKQQTRGIQS